MTISFQPDSIDFGDVGLGEVAIATISVSNAGDNAVNLVVLDGSGGPSPQFSIVPATIPAGTQNGAVDVLFQPDAANSFTATVSVEVDEPDGPTVALSGAGREDVQLTPPHVDFGVVSVGSSEALRVTVRNFSTQTVNLTVDPPFSIVPALVLPNATIQATMTFAPDSGGDFGEPIVGVDLPDPLGRASGSGATAIVLAAGGTRYRVTVPTKNSELVLGGDLLADGEGRIDGALLRTDGDLVADAVGTVVVQSRESDVLTIAGEDALFAANGTNYMSGDDGVVISAGVGDNPVSEIGAADDGQVQTEEADNVTGAISRFATGFAVFDTVVAGMAAFRGLWGWGSPLYFKEGGFSRLGNTAPNRWGTLAVNLAASGGAIGGAVVTGLSAAGALPGVGILAKAGVSIAANGFSSFYSIGGLVLGSMFPLIVGVDAELYGFRNAVVSGFRTATVQSNRYTKIFSHGDVIIEADGAHPKVNPGGALNNIRNNTPPNIKLAAANIQIGRSEEQGDHEDTASVEVLGEEIYLESSTSKFHMADNGAIKMETVNNEVLFDDDDAGVKFNVADALIHSQIDCTLRAEEDIFLQAKGDIILVTTKAGASVKLAESGIIYLG